MVRGEVQLEEFPEWWMGIKIKSSNKKKKKRERVGRVWRRTGGTEGKREEKRREKKEKRKISRRQNNQAAPCFSMSKQAA